MTGIRTLVFRYCKIYNQNLIESEGHLKLYVLIITTKVFYQKKKSRIYWPTVSGFENFELQIQANVCTIGTSVSIRCVALWGLNVDTDVRFF